MMRYWVGVEGHLSGDGAPYDTHYEAYCVRRSLIDMTGVVSTDVVIVRTEDMESASERIAAWHAQRQRWKTEEEGEEA